MKNYLFLLLFSASCVCCKAGNLEPSQIVLVTSPSWSSRSGMLQLLSKENGTWVPASQKIPVMLGRGGMGWGLGSGEVGMYGPRKIEGDDRAPAGVFKLGPAFGYPDKPPLGTKLPYRPATERDYFVDDPSSKNYNQWVRIPTSSPNDPKSLWHSFETMRRKDGRYEFGIVVQYNMHPIVPGAGSAIFLHIWKSPITPTSGCTAMSRENLLQLMRWISPARNPVLIQAPLNAVERIGMRFRLRVGETAVPGS